MKTFYQIICAIAIGILLAIIATSCTSRSEQHRQLTKNNPVEVGTQDITSHNHDYVIDDTLCIISEEFTAPLIGKDIKYILCKNHKKTNIYTYHSTHLFRGEVVKQEIIDYLISWHKKENPKNVFR